MKLLKFLLPQKDKSWAHSLLNEKTFQKSFAGLTTRYLQFSAQLNTYILQQVEALMSFNLTANKTLSDKSDILKLKSWKNEKF